MTITWSIPSWLNQSQLISIFSSCLVLPYLILSPLSGRLAVIYSKQRVYRMFKLLEIPTMMIACLAIYLQWIVLAVIVILTMGIYACLYSPSKYGLIRDIGGEKELSYGSSIFELLVFIGILLGTVCGALFSDAKGNELLFITFILIAIVGYGVSKQINVKEIPLDTESYGSLNPIKFFIDSLRESKNYHLVGSGVFGASVFWLIGGLLHMNLLIHCQHIYQTSNTVTGLVMACAAIGIASGCWFVGLISGSSIKIGLILVGILGMTIISLLITFLQLSFPVFIVLIFLMAFLGGIFQIPCLALVQDGRLGRKIGEMIAFMNFNTFGFVLIASVLFSISTSVSNQNSQFVFGVISIICIGVSLFFITINPHFRKETLKFFPRFN